MKLLHCKSCGDIRKIHKNKRTSVCFCGYSSARYSEEEYNKIVIFGQAVVVGIVGDSFSGAIKNCPKDGVGGYFRGYIIPKNSKALQKENI